MDFKEPLFYAKILLFGEYGIIKNSKALSIPYNSFKGVLKIGLELDDTNFIKSNQSLKDFHDYLSLKQTGQEVIVRFDLDSFSQDISRGLYFESTIPQGYGVGSSGALVAAIYERYAIDKIDISKELNKEVLLKLKHIFSYMESFFHGNSSGLDPLNSYLSLPILINSKDDVKTAGIPKQMQHNKSGVVFLIDSGLVGQTEPMVHLFMEKMKQEGFRNMLKNHFIKHTNNCVDDFLKGNVSSLFSNIKELSNLALCHFSPMIPSEFHKLWKKGIESNDYFLKLCGSGGGGYILGFAPDFEKAKQKLYPHKLELVYHF